MAFVAAKLKNKEQKTKHGVGKHLESELDINDVRFIPALLEYFHKRKPCV